MQKYLRGSRFCLRIKFSSASKKIQWYPRFTPTGAISKCDENGNVIQRFGGGQDLTPYYLFEDATFSNLQNNL
jgi:hypothetical protein